ncbi:MAG TPA: NAD-dependent succinate-semialdehyde dehydrogenase [Gammaproteobacteria bacterium]
MAFTAINPANGEVLAEYPHWSPTDLDCALQAVAAASPSWARTPIANRCALMRRAGQLLRDWREDLALLISREMGKLLRDARIEVDKCALACDYYAEHGPAFLADEVIATDAARSYIAWQPLGTVLAVMPWNFPLWQVFRFAAPALVAGNTAVLKHASNVPGCAQAIETLLLEAGFPPDVFRTLMISASDVEAVIRDRRIHAVTLTGSEPAGRQVAATAGAVLKKCVLELGGADPFVVLRDADLELTVAQAVASRFLNGGQSCIAAKRFIVVDEIAAEFLHRFKAAVERLVPGDPLHEETTLAPLARPDLREELHRQVMESVAAGAVLVTGGHSLEGAGNFYAPTILDQVAPGQRAYREELFGPVASVIRVRNEAEALCVANDSEFGLGGSVWTADTARGEQFARQLESGCAFVNGMVKSDPRLPFGGIKHSGFGRELSHLGMREFVNAKTIWIR